MNNFINICLLRSQETTDRVYLNGITLDRKAALGGIYFFQLQHG